MRRLFVDSVYWIALLYRRDRWHMRAVSLAQQLQGIPLVTTQEVLAEVLTYFAGHGQAMRHRAVQAVRRAMADANLQVLPQTAASFAAGLGLYEARPDKEYSLIDCISMAAMRSESLTEVLTHDHHFEQEGFVVLLRQP